MEEAHGAECIHGNVLQWPPLLNFSPWVNLTDQALSWSVYKLEANLVDKKVQILNVPNIVHKNIVDKNMVYKNIVDIFEQV